MKNIELLNLEKALKEVGGYPGVKFGYGVAKNLNIIESEIKAINKASEPSKVWQEYDKKRVDLAIKHAEKDANKIPKRTPPDAQGRFSYIIADETAFSKDWDELKAKYKDALDKREKQEAEWLEFLEKETAKIVFHKIKLSDVPKEITGNQLANIYQLIEQ